MNLRRTRYQQGSLTIEKRKNGPDVYVYRWREMGADGKATRRKQIVGLKSAFPSEAAARRAVDGLELDINTVPSFTGPFSSADASAVMTELERLAIEILAKGDVP